MRNYIKTTSFIQDLFPELIYVSGIICGTRLMVFGDLLLLHVSLVYWRAVAC